MLQSTPTPTTVTIAKLGSMAVWEVELWRSVVFQSSSKIALRFAFDDNSAAASVAGDSLTVVELQSAAWLQITTRVHPHLPSIDDTCCEYHKVPVVLAAGGGTLAFAFDTASFRGFCFIPAFCSLLWRCEVLLP